MQLVDQTGDIQIRTRQTIAITKHHRLRNALHTNRRPQRRSDQVLGDGNLFYRRAQLGEQLGSFPDFGIRGCLGFWATKSFLENTDTHALYTRIELFRIVQIRRRAILTRIIAIMSRNHLEHERIVGNGSSHRTGVININLNRHNAGVRH